MAKKNNKDDSIADVSGQTTPSSSPSIPSTASLPTPTTKSKAKDWKASQPSTSALIICRNKYVYYHHICPSMRFDTNAVSQWSIVFW
jgi:hypothetical protein